MKIYGGGRQNGKTTKLITKAAEHGLTIVTYNQGAAEFINRQAKKMGLVIPKAIYWRELAENSFGRPTLKIAVDNVEWVLTEFLESEYNIEIVAATVTTE